MRRHWQHTSFCMGQCVSSCGSKRTLDSVPTTPDTEYYPGLIPSVRSVKPSIVTNVNYNSCEQALDLSSKTVSRTSSAAKFVTVFAQKKIIARRINPGHESPVLVVKQLPPSTLPLTVTTLLTPVPVSQHGDMKGSPVKNYFRETISNSAKKSSKTVTFSEGTPSSSSSSSRVRKKPFFSFTKSPKSDAPGESGNKEPNQSTSGVTRGFLRRKPKNSRPDPAQAPPPKEKQVCRVTLSPKQGTSKSGARSPAASPGRTRRSVHSCKSGERTNGCYTDDQACSDDLSRKDNQDMGNASSSNAIYLNEVATRSSKLVVKSNSANLGKDKGDINENTTPYPHLVTSRSADSQVQNDNDAVLKSKSDVLKNLNLIREENRLLRLKFFEPVDSVDTAIGGTSEGVSSPKTRMNRQNLSGSRSAIPLPKTITKPTTNNPSGLPKLYSIPTTSTHQLQEGNKNALFAKPQSVSKADPASPAPSSSAGKWVPASHFFESPSTSDSPHPHTSPGTTRGGRRSSEPPRWASGSIANKFTRKNESPGSLERRETVGFQPKKVVPTTQPGGIPRVIKPITTISEKNPVKLVPTKIGVKKPEETRPFYTIGLYQNRPKPVEGPKSAFGVLQSGFQGVSTGLVRQRTEQYQSKVSQVSKRDSQSSSDGGKSEHNSQIEGSPGSKRPGVLRSATYTIRKHPFTQSDKELKGQGDSRPSRLADTDPKYLTWTVKKGSRSHTAISNFQAHYNDKEMTTQREASASPECYGRSGSHPQSVGYALQHDASGASTSSMGTNEDGAGDHVVISDSEYLIDDEISDQPELTLTFKDSSLIHSPSSSGESLISCDIMLDHLDQNPERILGELTSDSAISDVSSHMPIPLNRLEQISKLTDGRRSLGGGEDVTKAESREAGSPSSARTVKHLKSPRRSIKSGTPGTTSTSRVGRQPSGDTSIPRLTSGSSYKSPISSASATPKSRITPEKRAVSTKPRTSLSASSLSSSPRNKSDQVVGLTIENVSKLHKQYDPDTSSSGYNSVDPDSLPVPLVDELLSEFQGITDKLGQLQAQLESQERREREKDELILRLNREVERLKSLVAGGDDNLQSPGLINGNLGCTDSDRVSASSHKEQYMTSLIYENAAVQTENNNIFNRAVSYPEEEDKYGELVSFRIGRSSSTKKKV